MYLRALLLACLFLVGHAPCLLAQDSASYSFLAFGHIYGKHEDTASTQPAQTLQNAVPLIRELAPDHIMILGDVVRDLRLPVRWQNYERFMAQLPGQHYLAPGNHDPDPCPAQPVTYVEIAGDPHLILCTECLVQHQAGRLIAAVEALAGKVAQTKGNLLFVHSHRLPWILAEDSIADLDEMVNAPLLPEVALDSVQLLQHTIQALQGAREMHWFSGDLGAEWSLPTLCAHFPNRHYYAAGLGDRLDDVMWEVKVEAGKSVHAELVLLYDQPNYPVPDCGILYWRERMHPKIFICFAEEGFDLRKHWKKLALITLILLVAAAGFRFWRKRRRRLSK